ncbi:MAG: hypothetical protein ACXABY_35365, partial [Candidatus Thorarchaeota archaeon]
MTVSNNERVVFDQQTQAILEGRLTYDPIGYGDYLESTPKVVTEWMEVLGSPKMDLSNNQTILDTQKKFFEHVRNRPLYKNKTDAEFKEHVIKPVMDRTFEDSRFRYDPQDAGVSGLVRGLFAAQRAIPGSDIFLPTAEAEGVKNLRYMLDITADLSDRVIHLSDDEMVTLRKSMTPGVGIKEANKIVGDAIKGEEADRPLFSGRRIAEYTVPRVSRMVAEFALLKKLGIPLKHKALTSASPGIARAIKTAETLGAHTALTDLHGWKDDPVEKVNSVMKSAGFGAVIGPVREYVKAPIARMGIITGGIAAKTYASARLTGADSEEAARGAFHSIETLLALELSGMIQNKAALRRAKQVNRQ